MNILARLGIRLGVDSSELTSGLEKSEREVKRFESNVQKSMRNAQKASEEASATLGRLGIAFTVASAGMAKLFQKADEIADMASAFDASIGSIVGMGRALDLSGSKAENLTNILSKLSLNAEQAKEGNDKLRLAFTQLGISAGEVENLKPDELFERVAQELAKVENVTERNAKAFELLGKSAKGIDWNAYNQQYRKLADPDLTQAIQTSAQAWDNIQKAMSSLYYFTIKLIQPFAELVNQLTTIADRYREFKEQGGTINFDPNNPMGEGIEFKGTGKPAVSSAQKAVPKSESQLKAEAQAEWSKRSAEGARIQGAKDALKIAIEQNEVEMKRIQLETDRVRLTDFEYRRQQEILNAERKTLDLRNQILALERQRNDTNMASTDLQIEGLRKQIELEQTASEARVRNITIEEERSYSWAFGWEQAFKKFSEDAQNYSRVGGQAFNSIISNMNSALDRFVQTGKLSFKDFARSVIQDLIAIQLKAQAMSMLRGIGSLFSVATGNVLQAQTGVMVDDGGVSLMVGARAMGGAVSANEPYLVGERGAELFVPNGSGTIIPNNQLTSALSTGTTINYNGTYVENMSAIDTQSATQFLAKNKEAVWSANQSASRSLPASR